MSRPRINYQKRYFTFLAYIPVLHQGYLDFFAQFPEVEKLYLLDRWFLDRYRNLQKDIRAVQPEVMKKMVESLERFERVEILSEEKLHALITNHQTLNTFILPDEEISNDFAQEFLANHKVEFAPIFLRWDATKSTKPFAVDTDSEITEEEFHQTIMHQATELAEKSKDWWRQVGAVLVKDGEILFEAYNTHLPSEQQPYVDGDPRADFHKGDHIELSTAIHAESQLIAQAAQQGFSTAGADLYVTTYPCPVCAKLIAESGIKRVFFKDGYAMLDGERVLKAKGIKIIRVKL